MGLCLTPYSLTLFHLYLYGGGQRYGRRKTEENQEATHDHSHVCFGTSTIIQGMAAHNLQHTYNASRTTQDIAVIPQWVLGDLGHSFSKCQINLSVIAGDIIALRSDQMFSPAMGRGRLGRADIEIMAWPGCGCWLYPLLFVQTHTT